MIRTGDPVRDQIRYESDLEDQALLHCDICGAALYEGDAFYEINDMEICPECLNDNYRRLA